MTMTDDQRAMKELLEEYCAKQGMSFISFLKQFRRPDEPIGGLIQRVYEAVEAKG